MRHSHLSYYPDGTAFRNNIYHGIHIDGPDYSDLGKPSPDSHWFASYMEFPTETPRETIEKQI